jgi:hypothetical protein
VEPGNGWYGGEGWPDVVALIELAKQAPPPLVSPERRARIIQEIMVRVEANRQQRRVRRAFVAGAAAIVLLGLALKLVSVGVPWLRAPTEMADKAVPSHTAAE